VFLANVSAVACAAALQARLSAAQGDSAPERRIVLRIGVHLGDVVVEGEDLLGDGMNIAARLEQICPPEGVLISAAALLVQAPTEIWRDINNRWGAATDQVGRAGETERLVPTIDEPGSSLALGRTHTHDPTATFVSITRNDPKLTRTCHLQPHR
jgi:hypothetical protein